MILQLRNPWVVCLRLRSPTGNITATLHRMQRASEQPPVASVLRSSSSCCEGAPVHLPGHLSHTAVHSDATRRQTEAAVNKVRVLCERRRVTRGRQPMSRGSCEGRVWPAMGRKGWQGLMLPCPVIGLHESQPRTDPAGLRDQHQRPDLGDLITNILMCVVSLTRN